MIPKRIAITPRSKVIHQNLERASASIVASLRQRETVLSRGYRAIRPRLIVSQNPPLGSGRIAREKPVILSVLLPKSPHFRLSIVCFGSPSGLARRRVQA